MSPTTATVENLKGAGWGEASRFTERGPMGEKRKTIEAGERGREESISGMKAVPVALIKAACERRNEDEDQTEASWSSVKKSWRWRARA